MRLAKAQGLKLRLPYTRLAKPVLVTHQRYAQAKQFKRAGKMKCKLKIYLGRTRRDIEWQIKGKETLESIFRHPL